MKPKMPKMLIELTVMLLVFALAAALCLQGFLWADGTSRQQEQKAEAWQQLQNHAQKIQAAPRENWETQLCFDENWQQTKEDPAYLLQVTRETPENALLGAATVTVQTAAGQILAQSRICWQEVAP